MQTPNLGSTWEEALKSAYHLGYDRTEFAFHDIKSDIRELAEEVEHPISTWEERNYYLSEIICEGMDYNHFWYAIENFYESHMPEEDYERFLREAAVAEDFVTAYDTGFYDGILGNERNPEDGLSFLLD